MKPICYDLCCGLGGWTEAFLAEGYECIGFDIEAHRYPRAVSTQVGAVKRPGMNWSDRTKRGSKAAQFNRSLELDESGEWEEYPGELRLRDIRTLHGSELRDAMVIVGSSPCQKYSYMAMPWKRSKDMVRYYEDRAHPERLEELNELFNAQFRIQREASEAAGRHIPMIVENVRGAQKWVGRAVWNYGSFYLWGDVPALMPLSKQLKSPGKNWNEWKAWDGREETKPPSVRPWGDAIKVGGTNISKVGFNVSAVRKMLHGNPNISNAEGRKVGGDWFGKECQSSPSRLYGSKIPQRKMVSAMIAKIPYPLAQHIARCFKPQQERATA